MSKNIDKNSSDLEQRASSSRASVVDDDFNHDSSEFDGFANKRERIYESIQNYFNNSKTMLLSSLQHLNSPATIIVIILLIATYILLGVAGTVQFSFYSKEVVQYITTNLDIIVNALLGFFYGPVTCAISVTLSCIVRMIASRQGFFIGYVITAAVAGFLHGWILYRHKTMWFGTRFRSFFTDLLAKAFLTRLAVSVVVNIFMKAIIYKIFIGYPIYEFILHYSKSEVELSSFYEFLQVFTVSLAFDTMVVFIGLVVVNFIVSKAFTLMDEQPSIIIDENGNIINIEDEMMDDDMMDDEMLDDEMFDS